MGNRNLLHREGDEDSRKNWAGSNSDAILTKNEFCPPSENLNENEFKDYRWVNSMGEIPRWDVVQVVSQLLLIAISQAFIGREQKSRTEDKNTVTFVKERHVSKASVIAD